MRNLLLFLLLLLAVYLIRRALSRDDGQGAAPPAQDEAAPRGGEQVLPCEHCGVLVPHSEGVTRAGRFYCSAEHAELGPRGG